MLPSSLGTNDPAGCPISRLLCEKWDRLLFKNTVNREHDGRIL